MTNQLVRLAFVCSLFFAAAELNAEPDASKAQEASQTENTVEDVAKQTRSAIAVVSITGRDGKQHGIGTGFAISSDGLVATNLHVIGEARPIEVQFADGKNYKVTEVHASDRPMDLAILRIDAKDLPHLKLGDSERLRQGQPVVAIGNPQGLKHSVVSGVVSGVREMDGRKMVQLAIPIEPGNSGGPLLDMDGNVHGILTMKSLVTDNLGFAVAINQLKPLIEKPNPVLMSRWLTIGKLDPNEWQPLFGANWHQRAGRIMVSGSGKGFGGRALCLFGGTVPKLPYEVAVTVKLDDEAGAAGLVFHSDGDQRHYGFYPSAGGIRLSRFDGPTVFTWKVLHDIRTEHYRPGKWNRLKVRLEADKIRCYVNDQLVIESTDRGLSKGKVGLAKFRQTQAEFKGFAVGDKIPSAVPSPDIAAQINSLIDKLPAPATAKPTDLDPLANQAPASVALMLQRAERLEQQAVEMRSLAAEVHAHNVVAELGKVMRAKEDEIDLARAALLIARLDNREVDVDGYLQDVERMAADIKKALPEKADSAAKRASLDDYLFKQNGFHGSRTDYYHRANSYLSRVLDDREGLPITLSLLYMELGRRLGLSIEGVGLPGHFVVRHRPEKGDPQLIDVFDGATSMSRPDAAKKVREITGGQLLDEHLKSATKRSIVVRMLHNLYGLAERDRDQASMLRYVEAMLAVDPGLVAERGLRSVLRFQTGRHEAALADLDWFLENKPEGVDLERIREMRARFEGQMNR